MKYKVYGMIESFLLLMVTALIISFSNVVFAQSYAPTDSGKAGLPVLVNLHKLSPSSTPQRGIIEMPGPGLNSPSHLKELQNLSVPPFYGGATLEEDPASQPKSGTLKVGKKALSVPKSTQSYSLGGPYSGIQNTGYNPPDPVIASGANYVLEAVNLSFAIYEKW